MVYDNCRHQNERYHSDPEFRKRKIAYSIQYGKDHIEQKRASQRKRYAAMSPEKKQARLIYLKELREKRKLQKLEKEMILNEIPVEKKWFEK